MTVEGAFELTCYTEEYDAWVDRAVERIEELEEEEASSISTVGDLVRFLQNKID